MPVNDQIHSSTDAQTMVVDVTDPLTQDLCTCNITQDRGFCMDYQPTTLDSNIEQQEQAQQAQQFHQESQQSQQQFHSINCVLHSKESIALLKQQQQDKLKQLLEIQETTRKQEELKRRRQSPFEPVRMTPTRTFDLHAGSRFQGTQRSGDHSYDVRVDIKHVDLNESFLCGYLHIDGLTEEYPQLTTYFEAEIIGPKHSFYTRKWDADEMIDEEHWTQFDQFDCLANSVFYGINPGDEEMEEDDQCSYHMNYDPHTYSHVNQDVVFMRWKEHFLVPDHRVEGISGASFAGFYYICYNKKNGSISGYYYHNSSEKFQQLLLDHVGNRTSASYEFR
ncbi:GID complex subunit 4, VID24 [Entomortierella beljakovae]|nr:GID complex subunit 4, VID24 [Entomortierella beljakovae]